MRLARSTIYVLAVATALGTAACGGGGDDDGADDDGTTVEGDHHTYVIDSVSLPLTPADATQLGFDLDGDGSVDNQLGNILSALAQTGGSGLDLQGSIETSVDNGTLLLLADIQATSLTSASNAGFRLYVGANPSPAACTDVNDPTTCRKHLDGMGSFDIAANSPTDVLVGGNIVNGTFDGGPGNLTLSIVFGDTPINLNLINAQAKITGIEDGLFGDSKVGGAVPNDDIQTQVIPAVYTAISNIVTEDCPGTTPPDCGCVGGSTGETLLGIFDTDDAASLCVITEDEIRNNSLITTLLRPDVDTDGDSTPDSLSVGVGATGIKGTFTVP